MRSIARGLGLSAAIGLFVLSPALAQNARRAATPGGNDPAPAIVAITPAGATVGKTTEWTVVGRNLQTVERWLFSGAGVEVVDAKPKEDGTSTQLQVKVADSAEVGYREIRAIGTKGLSNLALFRVDRLDQVVEVEPNDSLDKAQEVKPGSAVSGLLKPQDIDHYKLTGQAGGRATIEVEAQRLGVPVVPVVTILSATGNALAQARETRGADHDCRLSFVFPANGVYYLQVHDNTYGGAEQAAYRVRIHDEPFGTALFPLGGAKGQDVTVTVSGGNLAEPRSKTVHLPDNPGDVFNPGPFDGPGGPVLAPARMVIGDGPEVIEAAPDAQSPSTTALPLGATANGRIAQPGEVDRYTLKVKKGEPLRIRVRAADLGSWLDSVVTILDDQGNTLAENDDPVDTQQQQGQIIFNQGGGNTDTDSRLIYEPKADGAVTLEITDRYGEGGPEYGYRLETSVSQADFSIAFLFAGNPAQPRVAAGRRARNTPAATGALNLKPGSSTPVNFQITSEGRTGPIEVRAEGLPPGVTAKPVTVRPTPQARNARRNNQPAQFNSSAIALSVEPDAPPGLAAFRLVATAKPENSSPITRVATALIPLDQVAMNNAGRMVTHPVSAMPVAVVDDAARKPAVAAAATPPTASPLTLKAITVPGPLLQGSRIDLALVLDPPKFDPAQLEIEAEAMGKGLGTQALVGEAAGAANEGAAMVKVLAAVDAEPGNKVVRVALKPKGKPPMSRDVEVVVRPPFALRMPAEPVLLEPGSAVTFRVGIERETGFAGPVELRFDRLPAGVKAEGRLTLKPGEESLEIKLQMGKSATPLSEAVAFGITGVARMPRGPVRVKSEVRPMLAGRPADK
jgi:hypothetical protein